jgi:hypothetical protein
MKIFTRSLILVSFLLACQHETDIPTQNFPFQGKEIVLGAKLKNPYTVSVMRQAKENIIARQPKTGSFARTIADLDIRTTTLYIRYRPINYEQYDNLLDTSPSELYNYPLDYEMIIEGDYYHDSDIPPDQPTWQYTALQVGQPIPSNVTYEILDELYLPEDDYDLLENGQILEVWQPVVYELEDEALRLTGNGYERITNVARTQSGSWRPSGTIMLFDDVLNANVPVVGAKVNARRWFTTYTGITDANGNFSVDGTFRRPAKYNIKWERADWDIRSGTWGQAYFNGPKKEGRWDLLITSGASRMYAIVHAALHNYFYGNRLGLKSPPTYSFLKNKMKVAVFEKDNSTEDGEVTGRHVKDWRLTSIVPRLWIWNGSRTSAEIYGTTIHELAHASHWELRKNNWNDNNTEEKVKESWARGVQWALGRLRYPNYPGGNTNRPSYTQVVVDMIDGPSVTDQNFGSERLSEDNVSGYTIKEIEDALIGQGSWNGWRDNIKIKYANATENNLDALFAHWD